MRGISIDLLETETFAFFQKQTSDFGIRLQITIQLSILPHH